MVEKVASQLVSDHFPQGAGRAVALSIKERERAELKIRYGEGRGRVGGIHTEQRGERGGEGGQSFQCLSEVVDAGGCVRTRGREGGM